jgi:non-ribosomal peptide synthetase-like protein
MSMQLSCDTSVRRASLPTFSVPAPRRLHHYFERQCDANPGALALVCGTEQLSYAELDARANRLANYLARRDIGPGDHVGLLVERSVHGYVALLAALKCGAAYVPIDPAAPADRVAFMAEDAALDLLLTTSKFRGAPVGCPVLAVDEADAALAAMPATRRRDPEDDAPCYVIYTSGTTGRPKGVTITHSSICNLLEVSRPVYGVTARDRVYQGMTFSFDFSVEEVWHTLSAGATLVAGPSDHRKLGGPLAEFLREHEITVLCCVPTLLATLPPEVPALRTLIVGGEACPPELVKRWGRPGLRMLNTYGPTETTVTATWTEVRPDAPVTIGQPFPTYTLYILDTALRRVPDGEVGEICIGGPGVGVGYLNRPELTQDRFVSDPFATAPDARMYRTGDLGRVLPGGDVEFLGRIDTQIKFRGYRMEPAEVEAVLLECTEVENAVVNPLSEGGVIVDLAAYVTLHAPAANLEELRGRLHATLQNRLPGYMVPAYLEVLDSFPQLPSGKVNRARLPAPSSPRLGGRTVAEAIPATPLESTLAAAWGQALGRANISVEADFFYDLGGHSLAAAQAISHLRREPGLTHLGIGDLYAHPTVRALARHIESTASQNHAADTTRPAAPARLVHSSARVWACGAAQLGLGCLFVALLATPFVLFFQAAGSPTLLSLAVCLFVFGVCWMPLSFVLPVAFKWLLIGRFRPGRYPLWGWYYCRWWLARKAIAAAPTGLLAGSPLMGLYLRLLGARVGPGCHIGSAGLHLPDLIEIGANASIGYGAELKPFTVEGGWLHVAPVRVGVGAFIGTNALVMPGGSVGDNARVLEQSLVAQGQAIPDNETWSGSPSRRLAGSDAGLDAMERQSGPARWSPALLAGFTAGYLLLILLPLLLLVPGLAFLYLASGGGEFLRGLLAAPIAGMLFVLTTWLGVSAARKLITPRVEPGLFPLRSGYGLRKWLSDKLTETGLRMTNSAFGTLYVRPWMRLLGVRMGARAEVSTVAHIDPDLLDLGPESFTADLAVIGSVRYHNGMIALGATRVGARTFVGNSALLPGGTQLPDRSLIGVLSVAPAGPIEAGSSWLGSPAIFLPRRQESAKFDESVTFQPPARLYALRLTIELFRLLVPSVLGYALLFTGALAFLGLVRHGSPLFTLAVLPVLYLALACVTVGVVAGLKWLVVGRYRPRVEPLWSHFVWRSELITGLYENTVVPALLAAFTGTPFLPPLLRLFGARIGRRVWMDTTFLTEFDLVHVGDDTEIGGASALQTHLFEDRVMKMSTVTVGSRCTVGSRTVVLYDATIEDGARLDSLSLAMKGETLPAESSWRGIPARPAE